jgi:hypothetical protein
MAWKILRATFVVALAAILVGVIAGGAVLGWGEFERGRYRARLPSPPETPGPAEARNGYRSLGLALDWYREFLRAGSEPHAVTLPPEEAFQPGYDAEISVYVKVTRPFISLLLGATTAPTCVVESSDHYLVTSDSEMEELTEYAARALLWRVRHHARLMPHDDNTPHGHQTGATAETLDALHHLFLLVRFLPPDSLTLARVRNVLFTIAVRELRTVALMDGFPAAVARPVFDEALRLPEDDGAIARAVAGQEAHVITRVAETLEPNAEDGYYLRRNWFRLSFQGRPVPLLYRGATTMLERLDEVKNVAALPPAEQQAALDRIADAAASPWLVEWDEREAAVTRTRDLLTNRASLLALARITRIGLAAVEYRQKKSAWPRDPAELASMLKGGLPVDPATGGLFEFQRSDKEFVLAPSEGLRDAGWTLRAAE